MLTSILAIFSAIPSGALGALTAIAGFFGISPLRLIIYAACAVSVVSSLLIVRHHYVKLGYDQAITRVQQQDARAVKAAKAVQQQTSKCDETNGYWDVITQNCRLGDAQ